MLGLRSQAPFFLETYITRIAKPDPYDQRVKPEAKMGRGGFIIMHSVN